MLIFLPRMNPAQVWWRPHTGGQQTPWRSGRRASAATRNLCAGGRGCCVGPRSAARRASPSTSAASGGTRTGATPRPPASPSGGPSRPPATSAWVSNRHSESLLSRDDSVAGRCTLPRLTAPQAAALGCRLLCPLLPEEGALKALLQEAGVRVSNAQGTAWAWGTIHPRARWCCWTASWRKWSTLQHPPCACRVASSSSGATRRTVPTTLFQFGAPCPSLGPSPSCCSSHPYSQVHAQRQGEWAHVCVQQLTSCGCVGILP